MTATRAIDSAETGLHNTIIIIYASIIIIIIIMCHILSGGS